MQQQIAEEANVSGPSMVMFSLNFVLLFVWFFPIYLFLHILLYMAAVENILFVSVGQPAPVWRCLFSKEECCWYDSHSIRLFLQVRFSVSRFN